MFLLKAIIAAQALSLGSWQPVSDSQSSRTSWAVIGTREIDRAGLLDLAVTELSRRTDIELVERQDLNRLVDELRIANALASSGVEHRLELGRIAGADRLLILTVRTIKDTPKLYAVACDCVTGTRLEEALVPDPQKYSDQATREIGTLVSTVVSRFPRGVETIIAVAPFVNRSLSSDLDDLQVGLARLLEHSFRSREGVATLEFEEAHSILREYDVQGTRTRRGPAPLIIEAEFKATERGEDGPFDLKIKVQESNGSGVHEERFENLTGLVQYLTSSHTKLIGRNGIAPASSEKEQLQTLKHRADVLTGLGSYWEAASLREAGLLISPRDFVFCQAAIEDYLEIFPFDLQVMIAWERLEPVKAKNDLLARFRAAERAVELARRSIDQRLLDACEAVSLGRKLNGAYERLCFRLPQHQDVQYRNLDESVWICARDGSARVYEAMRRFTREDVPRIPALAPRPIKGHASPPEPEWDGRCMHWWLQLAIALPRQPTADPRPWGPPTTVMDKGPGPEDLAHMEYILLSAVPDVPLVSTEMLVFLCMASLDPDHIAQYSDSEFEAFLSRLKASPRQVNQYYGELGFMFRAYARGSGSAAMRRAALIDSFEGWAKRLEDYCGHSHWRSSLIPQMERTLGPIREASAAQQTMSKAPSESNRVLRIEPIRMFVRTKKGKVQRLQCNRWYNLRGWFPSKEQWQGLIPCDKFDAVWTKHHLLFHRTPGVLDVIMTLKADTIHEVTWDGQNVWCFSGRSTIKVRDRDGRVVATSIKGATPAINKGAKALAIEPGKVVLAAAMGPKLRTWVGLLTIQGNAIDCKVIHEAKESHSEHKGRSLPADDDIAFVPFSIARVPDPDAAGGYYALVMRGIKEEYALRINPELLQVDLMELPLRPWVGNSYGHNRYHFRSNGDWLAAGGSEITQWIHPRNRSPGQAAIQLLYKHQDSDQTLDSFVFEHGEHLYVPGSEWIRLDGGTLSPENIGYGLGTGVEPSFSTLATSAHFGLLFLSEPGEVGLVSVPAANEMPRVLNVDAPYPPIDASDLRDLVQVVEAVHAYQQTNDLWPRHLSDLSLQSVKKTALEAFELRACYDCGAEVRMTSGSVPKPFEKIAYKFGGSEQGWYGFRGDRIQEIQVQGMSVIPNDALPANLLQNVIAEFNQRIASDPENEDHHRAKTSYLLWNGAADLMHESAVEWCAAFPRSTIARQALVEIERYYRFGVSRYGRLDARRHQPGSFAIASLFNHQVAAQSLAQDMPFAVDETEFLLGEFGAYNQCWDFLFRQQYSQIVTLCDRWQAAAESHESPCDRSYFAFRAVAKAHMNQQADALRDAKHAVEAEKAGLLWAGPAAELLKQMKAKKDAVTYQPPQNPDGVPAGAWYWEPVGSRIPRHRVVR